MAEQYVEKVLHVDGMTCGACEQRIETRLLQLPGVKSAEASFSSGTLTLCYDTNRVTVNEMEAALREQGYTLAPTPGGSKIGQLLRIAAILAGIALGYWLLQATGAINFFPMATEQTALPMLFIIGLLTSVHCVAMCGGIAISQCASVPATHGKTARLLPSLLYNSGRVISYTIIGGIVGGIGAAITPSGRFKGAVAILAALFMLIMGLNLLTENLVLRKLMPRLPKSFRKKVNEKKVGKGPFVVGLLNGFMPCGPLQAMQLYALSTGSILMGALSMLLFSLGTVPLMFGLGALSSFLNARFTTSMMKVSAVLVILLGLMMLNNGLSLSGFNLLF